VTTVRPGRPAAPIRIVGTPGARLVGTKGLRLLSEPRRFVGLEARDGSVMNVRNARMELLGYDRAERYGVSWRTGATSGVVHRSLFRGNFYGVYTHGIAALRVTESVVEESHRYGLDPHSGSRNLVIESNIFRRNGKHGMILAVGC
jgi:hypothetical protein